MEAMIFAAGLGTRLFPITRDRPKALAPFLDQTLLAYNIRFLSGFGIRKFVINTHHFSGMVEEYLDSKGQFGMDIVLSYETILLDTAGGLAKASGYFSGHSPILLYNVDVISNIRVDQLLDYHLRHGHKVSLAVRQRESSRKLLFNEDQDLCGWRNLQSGKEITAARSLINPRAYAFSGIHVISPEILDLLEKDRIYSLTDFYLENMDRIQIKPYLHDQDYWFDCGNPESLKLATEMVSHQARNKQ